MHVNFSIALTLSFFICTYLSFVYIIIWIWLIIIIHMNFKGIFTHYFSRNSAKAKMNEVGREQNKQKQYNLVWLLQIPFTLTLRLWDIFILEGEKILTGMAYNIIKLHRSKWKYDQACLLSLWNFLIQQWTCSLDEKLIFANVQMSDIIWLWSICWDLICSF